VCLEDDLAAARAPVANRMDRQVAVRLCRLPRKEIDMKTDNSHLIIEVRAAEGGDDAKALVALQVAIYARLANRRAL
jgi:protein subunit release factor A